MKKLLFLLLAILALSAPAAVVRIENNFATTNLPTPLTNIIRNIATNSGSFIPLVGGTGTNLSTFQRINQTNSLHLYDANTEYQWLAQSGGQVYMRFGLDGAATPYIDFPNGVSGFFIGDAFGLTNIYKLGAKNVRDYGAKVDGVTDDTAAINAALIGGGDVYMPDGAYNVNRILVSYSNTRLFGSRAAVLTSTNLYAVYITGGNVSNVTISGFSLIGANTNTVAVVPQAGVIVENGTTNYGTTIEDLFISGFKNNGIQFQQAGYHKAARIQGCRIINVGQGMSVSDVDDLIVSGNTFDNIQHASDPSHAVYLSNCRHVTVMGNTARNITNANASAIAVSGVKVGTVSGNCFTNVGSAVVVDTSQNISVSGNVGDGPWNLNGVLYVTTGSTNIALVGNVFGSPSNNAPGIVVYGAAPNIEQVSIVGNSLFGFTGNGMLLSLVNDVFVAENVIDPRLFCATQKGIHLLNGRDIEIKNNRITAGGDGIHADAITNGVISDNHLFTKYAGVSGVGLRQLNCVATPVLLNQIEDGKAGGWTARYSMDAAANSSAVVAQDNRFGFGTTTPGVTFEVGSAAYDVGELRLAKSGHSAGLGINAQGANWAASIFSEGTKVFTVDSASGVAIGASYQASGTIPANGAIIQGNVGVGTENPTNKLHVTGGITANNFITPTNAPVDGYVVTATGTSGATKYAAGGAGGSATNAAGSGSEVQFRDDGPFGADSLFTYNKTSDTLTASNAVFNGKVGIGTNGPVAQLHVLGGSFMTGGWSRTATLEAIYPALTFNSSNTRWGGIGYDFASGGGMRFFVNATNSDLGANTTTAMSLINDGKVGIGIAEPTARLHVVGDAIIRTNLAAVDPSSGFISALATEVTNATRRADLRLVVEFNSAATGTPQLAIQIVDNGITNSYPYTIPGGVLLSITNTIYVGLIGPGARLRATDTSYGTGASVRINASTLKGM